MPGFRTLLGSCRGGQDFLAKIRPHSEKSGAAMRAGVCGLLDNPQKVVDLAMWQASLTHATLPGMVSAAAAAMMVWHCRKGTPVADIPHEIDDLFPNFEFATPWTEEVPNLGIPVVRAALTALQAGSQATILKTLVDYGGDTDTVAAVAMAAASQHPDIEADLPDCLIEKMERGKYGIAFLADLDRQLCEKFGLIPPDGVVPAMVHPPAKPTPPPAPLLQGADPKKEKDLGGGILDCFFR